MKERESSSSYYELGRLPGIAVFDLDIDMI
jgi:hypothetical protein